MSRWNDYWRRLTGNYESTAILGKPNGNESLNWRKALSEADRRFIHAHAGELLIQLGYEKDDQWVTEDG
jgi:hypothetical protein